MRRRIKVGDVEVGFEKDRLDPSKTNYVVFRYQPKTGKYLSTETCGAIETAQYLFEQWVELENLRQMRAAQAAQVIETSELPAPHYRDHPYYARF